MQRINVEEENYLLQVLLKTKKKIYTDLTKEIVKSIRNIYRIIEPSHITGRVVIFYKISDETFFPEKGIDFYDESILIHERRSITIQLFQEEKKMPLLYLNKHDKDIDTLLKSNNYIAYSFKNSKEYIYVNGEEIPIINKYTCPSIFALQYHNLYEELLRYKNERVRKVSCEHFKKCWKDEKYIYFINKPEDSIQLSLSEYLKNSLRGVEVMREYTMDASKPVDIRVFWREANRAALIEVKLMGRSFNDKEEVNTYEYGNKRANDGMTQIKEYIDLINRDSPSVINKGYLIVIDGRRKKSFPKVETISLEDGMFYADKELEIDEDKKFYISHKNIEEPIRMFIEPICQ